MQIEKKMEYNLENYKVKVAEIEAEATKKKRSLAIEFANANNPYKKGDIVTDHIGSLRIEKMTWTFGFNNNILPYCHYYGIELKKDGTPMKKQSARAVSQTNIKR